MQSFIANGRVVADAVGKTSTGHVSFKFEFVCDTSKQDQEGKERKQEQLNMQQQSLGNDKATFGEDSLQNVSYPTPIDADEPF